MPGDGQMPTFTQRGTRWARRTLAFRSRLSSDAQTMRLASALGLGRERTRQPGR